MYSPHIQAPVIPGAQYGAAQVGGPAVPMQVAGPGAYLPMQEDTWTSMFSMIMPMIMMVMMLSIMMPMLKGIGGS
ncbi:MAG: cell division protein FtsH [Chloroflexota bacterium]|nr:cell division protein FtsH [Chloroflexota bacterium]